MNPPQALHGAMSRDRKPFTYTPGGLDLSEIKSERMAKRLMRNAMNQGVPELPQQQTQPSCITSPLIAVPNFNCLPVQVFPTFNLPANPKSLLRTRSNPGSRERTGEPLQNEYTQPQSQFVNSSKGNGDVQYDKFNKNTLAYSQINEGRPASLYDYGSQAKTQPSKNKGNDRYTSVLPEISYDAEYFQAPPLSKSNLILKNSETSAGNDAKIINFVEPKIISDFSGLSSLEKERNNYVDSNNTNIDSEFSKSQPRENIIPEFNLKTTNGHDDYYVPLIENFKNEEAEKKIDITKDTLITNSLAEPNAEIVVLSENVVAQPVEEILVANSEKKEVTVVKKEVVRTENSEAKHNGNHNRDVEVEAVMTVKLPTKTSEAKTDTKVEILKKTLPDGSIEEVKKTITKTTKDGKTEIKTETETTIIPKEEAEEVEEEIEEEEDEINETLEDIECDGDKKQTHVVVSENAIKEKDNAKANGEDTIIISNEKSEISTSTTKRVVVFQDEIENVSDDKPSHENEDEYDEEEEELEEEIEETEPVTVILKKPEQNEKKSEKIKEEIKEDEEVKEEEEEDNDVEQELETQIQQSNDKIIAKKDISHKELITPPPEKEEYEEEIDEEEEYEEAEEKVVNVVESKAKKEETKEAECKPKDEIEMDNKPKVESDQEIINNKVTEDFKDVIKSLTPDIDNKQEQKQVLGEVKEKVIENTEELNKAKEEILEEKITPESTKSESIEYKIPIREPSVPLEKVEDVEIKPIGAGDYMKKSITENTEITTTTTEKPSGILSEFNRIENIVTVNRTTKTLDQSYENITQQGIPTIKTYFTPHIDKISTSPLPARPYQSVYPSESTTERRHSLLLDRLSMERQMPSEIYQNTYSTQSIEQQRQWSQEPQAEVLTVSNVKPSQITNQQWYQQRENAINNNLASSPQPPTAPSWSQPKPQPQPQQQPLYQPQPQYQTLPQPQYQQPIPQVQPQIQYQPSYKENLHESKSYANSYSSLTPKPTNWATNNARAVSPIPTIKVSNQPNHYDYLSKDYTDTHQKTSQQYSSSSYVPPPWEQDLNYAVNTSQDYYQAPLQTNMYTPAPSQGWKPPVSKFNKTPPTSYIPPKPNQSFVKPVINVEPPKLPGRKTYYSEYERRYISVPESTYIPGETKFQQQPDPSPQYYYDNNDPIETVEPQWRRELREFTEKTQTQTHHETKVKPPWEVETKYGKAPEATYTPTPTWSQTLRPQSWRERSFESEFVSQEWPKTNTLGRGRPLTSYVDGKESIQERVRGVSVDRYNPNNYKSPVLAEHPPVQSHTHIPPAPHATGYHNPNVPAYHARASAEPREQISYQQPRSFREPRASPFQSRSFKYLQWITGTDD